MIISHSGLTVHAQEDITYVGRHMAPTPTSSGDGTLAHSVE